MRDVSNYVLAMLLFVMASPVILVGFLVLKSLFALFPGAVLLGAAVVALDADSDSENEGKGSKRKDNNKGAAT